MSVEDVSESALAAGLRAFGRDFLGRAPRWYKFFVIACLLVNPLILVVFGVFAAGWLLVAEFIFTLAMALKCYPLQPGGLLALEAVLIGMAGPADIYRELEHNLPVFLLLMFMVAGIFFMRELLLEIFSRLLLGVRRKWLLSLCFCAVTAVLAAFLDALTVTAIIIAVLEGLHQVYRRAFPEVTDESADAAAEASQFRAFLRSLVMNAAVGTAIGGVTTLVGQPQNLLIGRVAGWNFGEFFLRMAPVSLPVLVVGFVLCVLLEKSAWFGYGAVLPPRVRTLLEDDTRRRLAARDARRRVVLVVQAVAGVLLVAALALHVAEVGLIGLALLVVATAFTGVSEERRIAPAFEEAMPFTALLAVFFVIVAVINSGALFTPVIQWVLHFEGRTQLALLYLANGLLSAVSDNVFVATVYMQQIHAVFAHGQISRAAFDQFTVAINTGTNIPSVATPNGQAAFLFLLTSGLAPLIRLSYLRMVWMALPYTLVLSAVGLATLLWFV